MRTSSVLLTLCFLVNIAAFSQNAAPLSKIKSDADLYWENRPLRPKLIWPDIISTSRTLLDIADGLTKEQEALIDSFWIENYRVDEVYKMTYREWGLDFLARFPNDPRVYKWLRITTFDPPAYFINTLDGAKASYENDSYVAIDTNARNAWDLKYREILQCYPLTKDQKRELASSEFSCLYQRWWRSENSPKFDLLAWTKRLFEFMQEFGIKGAEERELGSLIEYANTFFSFSKNFGLTTDDLSTFLDILSASRHVGVEKFVRQKRAFLALKAEPFQLKGKTINDSSFDLENLRGKLVLLDFWSLGCSSCIKKMPEIKSVWDKYREMGFEVVSICTTGWGIDTAKGKDYSNYWKQRPQIIKIYNRIGAEWPLVLLEGVSFGEGGRIFEKYNFKFVPQLILLDQNGLMVEYNGDMLSKKGALEAAVAKHLQIKKGDNRVD